MQTSLILRKHLVLLPRSLPTRVTSVRAYSILGEAAEQAKNTAKTYKDIAQDAVDSVKGLSTTEQAKEQAKDATKETSQQAKQNANQAQDSAKSTIDQVKDTAKSTADQAKERATATADQVTPDSSSKNSIDQAKDTAEQAKEAAKGTAEQAKEKAKSSADQTKDAAQNTADKTKEAATKASHQTNMSSSDNSKTNASGLTPEESRNLPRRQPTKEEGPILAAMKELYGVKPTESTYSVYAENAVFHDPVSIAEGILKIRAQFNALPQLFPRTEFEKFEVLESPKTLSNSLLINQDVSYYRSEKPDDKPVKTLNSLLTIIKDNRGQILKHHEEWNHERVTDGSNAGFLGMLNEGRKKAFAAVSMPFVSQTPTADRE